MRKRDLEERLAGLVLEPCREVEGRDQFDAGTAKHVGRDRRARRTEALRVRSPTKPKQEVSVRSTPPVVPTPAQIPKTTRRKPEPPAKLSLAQRQQLRLLIDAENRHLEAETDRGRRQVAQNGARRAPPEAQRASEKVMDITKASSSPSAIERSDFDRAAFKADLAGLSHRFGDELKWVDVDSQDYKTLHLYSGATIVITPGRATSSEPALDAIPLMIDHALQSGWRNVLISSGDEAWREAAARAATRAGLAVDDEDLNAIVESELQERQTDDDSSQIGGPFSLAI